MKPNQQPQLVPRLSNSKQFLLKHPRKMLLPLATLHHYFQQNLMHYSQTPNKKLILDQSHNHLYQNSNNLQNTPNPQNQILDSHKSENPNHFHHKLLSLLLYCLDKFVLVLLQHTHKRLCPSYHLLLL